MRFTSTGAARRRWLANAAGIVAGATPGLASLVAPASARAQAWPGKPVRIMVGANAGGGTDIVARMLAEQFADAFKQQFIVENRPGASNTIAADLTAKAPPDGHTLLVATNTGQSIAPHLLKLSFDPIADLAPVALIVSVPNVLVVGPTVPERDVAALVAAMKRKPGEYRYASSGTGSTQHIAGEAFAALTGTQLVHVPYKGSSQAHVDLISGQVQLMFDTMSSATPQIRAGRLRPLAVMAATRSRELPDVPTIAEAGYAGAEMTTWYGLYTTVGTPPEAIERLREQTQRILQLPAIDAKLRGMGGEPGRLDRAAFDRMQRDEYARFGKLIRDANIKMQ